MMGNKIKYNIERELLLSLNWGNQYSIKEISKLFGCGYSTILRKMRIFRIPRNQLRDTKKGKPNWNSGKTNKDDSRILTGKYHPHYNDNKYVIETELLFSLYWGNQCSLPDIARLFKCSSSCILDRMKKYKIPRRDKILARDLKEGRFEKIFIIESELLWSLYWGNRYNQNDIANLFNCSKECIGLRMRECNIPVKHTMEIVKEQIKNNLPPTGHFGESVKDKYHNKGLVLINMRGRDSNEYREWRHQIFMIDDWTCQECGERGGDLNVHHIKSFAKYPDLRLDIDNGITLCHNCHYTIYHRGGC